MELINFCHPSLKPIVNCNQICNEDYDVKNLISKDPSSRRKGFMAYHTIRPPVDVTFEFICEVHISQVVIWPQVGCQKSCGFEIFGEWMSDAPNQSLCTGSMTSDSTVKIGYGIINGEHGIVFYNRRDSNRPFPPNFLTRVLSNPRNILQNLKTLTIKIVRTLHSSVPALGAVEIWGKPSKSCTKGQVAEALLLWNSANTRMCGILPKIDVKCNKTVVSNVGSNVQNGFHIPEDFIDPITCEIMVIPVVLPSGKIVDESTLERHRLAEAAWGRSPSDPFTGCLFTSTYKPVMAVALKARLDKFLMENANRKEIQGVPRTVGRRVGCVVSSANVSHLVDVSREINAGNNPSKECAANNASVNAGADSTVLPLRLKRTLENKFKFANEACRVNINPHSPSTASSSSKGTHDEMLEDSLEEALKATLSALPSFVNLNCKNVPDIPKTCCVQCKSCNMLYQLPCKHLLCRPCLMQKTAMSKLICSNCEITFRPCDPVKYHL